MPGSGAFAALARGGLVDRDVEVLLRDLAVIDVVDESDGAVGKADLADAHRRGDQDHQDGQESRQTRNAAVLFEMLLIGAKT